MVGFDVALHELVVGGAHVLEGFDQQNDDFGEACAKAVYEALAGAAIQRQFYK
jgi:hypothetical protein